MELQPTIWYTRDELFHYLKRKNYSDEIANELCEFLSGEFQKAFDKGFNKAKHELLLSNESWPLVDVMNELIKATEILLHAKDYDGARWEEMAMCMQKADMFVKSINQQKK